MHAIIVCVSLVHGHHSTPTRALLETPGALIWRRQYNVTSNACIHCIPKADSLDSGSNRSNAKPLRLGKMPWASPCLSKSQGRAFRRTRSRCSAIYHRQFVLFFLVQLIVPLFLATPLRMPSQPGIFESKLEAQWDNMTLPPQKLIHVSCSFSGEFCL